MNLFYKYKFYLYPFIVFLILALVILSFKLLQTENVNLIEKEKKIPLKTRIIYPEPIKPQFLFFGRIVGKNEINIVSRLSGKIVFVSEKLFNWTWS